MNNKAPPLHPGMYWVTIYHPELCDIPGQLVTGGSIGLAEPQWAAETAATLLLIAVEQMPQYVLVESWTGRKWFAKVRREVVTNYHASEIGEIPKADIEAEAARLQTV